MKHLAWLTLAMVAILAVGCGEKKEEGQSNAPAAALTDKELPTPSDYDDESEKQITPANYKSELDTLDKEIGAE